MGGVQGWVLGRVQGWVQGGPGGSRGQFREGSRPVDLGTILSAGATLCQNYIMVDVWQLLSLCA